MIRTSIYRALGRAGRALFPVRCAFCGAASEAGPVCDGCHRDLPWTAFACGRCGTALAAMPPAGVWCARCQQRPPPFSVAFAPLHYAFPVDAAIKALKFRRRLYLAPALASLALPWLASRTADFDRLLPVPLFRHRHALRGFNQAEEIARHLQAGTGIPISRCARRRRATLPQSGLDAAARRRNVKGAFEVRRSPDGARVLLIDDVMTTGETCRELAATLIDAGVEYVGVLTIARAYASARPRPPG
jgi:ComF family protein